ncbi:response regulator [Paraburkholderia xenovorans]|uniref:response regulator n=1 Tax=Paraburkholderia xenovorans TaxID=36873 RepID=UPI0038B99953
MVVDHELDAVEAMSLLLVLEGYEARADGSGTEVLQIVEPFVPDVALVDENMPQLNRLELAGGPRGYSALSGMKMVALSSFGQAADVQTANDAVFDFHLTKPVSIDDVIGATGKQQQSDWPNEKGARSARRSQETSVCGIEPQTLASSHPNEF